MNPTRTSTLSSLPLALLLSAGPASAQSQAAETATTIPVASACSLGEHSGVDEVDAQTTASIVCEEVRSHTGSTSARNYRVQINKLGSTYFLSLQSEQPTGTMIDRRQIQLAHIEEAPVVAPRLVTALLENKPLKETETVANLAGEDTRVRKRKAGEVYWGLGLIGTFVPGTPTLGPGGSVGLVYEADRFAVGADMRVSGASTRSDKFGMFTLGLGGRWFASDADVTPVLGGGFQLLSLSQTKEADASAADTASSYSSFSKTGVSAYGEAGLEALRTHRVHVLATVRADVPFFALEESGGRYDSTLRRYISSDASRYTVPLSLNTSVYFRW